MVQSTRSSRERLDFFVFANPKSHAASTAFFANLLSARFHFVERCVQHEFFFVCADGNLTRHSERADERIGQDYSESPQISVVIEIWTIEIF